MSFDQAPPAARVAVLIPCFNEEPTIATVIADFRVALPSAEIYVFDNNSTDRSVIEAVDARARVFTESRQGKGYVLQGMFRNVIADLYVVVDGDGTYSAHAVESLLEPVLGGRADMVIGSRLHSSGRPGFTFSHWWGNRFFMFLSRLLFRLPVTDVLSGYRVLTRDVARSVRLSSGGFAIETELTIAAIYAGFRVIDVPVTLVPRLPGSHSKIRIPRDGLAILLKMLALFRREEPATFLTGAALMLLISGILGWAMLHAAIRGA